MIGRLRPAWMDEAPCHGSEDHFPHPADAANALRTRRARRTCARCPLRRPCLEECYRPIKVFEIITVEKKACPCAHGIAKHRDEFSGCTKCDCASYRGDCRRAMLVTGKTVTSEDEGIWGGTTPQERKAVAHLPMPERLAVLELWLRGHAVGPFAVATPEEIREAM